MRETEMQAAARATTGQRDASRYEDKTAVRPRQMQAGRLRSQYHFTVMMSGTCV